MPITSVAIDGSLPYISGLKDLDDFIVTNWFSDMPAHSGTNIGGFYFGYPVQNLTMNSFNNAILPLYMAQ